MSSPLFQILDIGDFRVALEQLHELVSRRNGRVEVRRNGCDDCCVLISKSELESLEQALEILANRSEPRAMEEELRQVARSLCTDATAAPASK
jgi:PHD/YefM family antitoxin component YafN of YafNO toxin-antitoxin module